MGDGVDKLAELELVIKANQMTEAADVVTGVAAMTTIVGLGVQVLEVANRRATAMEAIARVEVIARKIRGKAVPASKTRKIQLMN